ncbi:Outer surface protein of unknown function, cellobiose operon [Alkalibacterium sp. AK22]|uniref:DUF871 domain-containing protein n=1 Tax=Alkalibacterium sp. AK22 TaxID=1229520 RepID=UPI0004467690|nr:MupG family TIM beta-alpha barrel fold protein [Alkalibacterium sp. AK22]EXJ23134.1 Outer surface protein of unknown function, cellobiose operon [Alkalibacterium sp. AK22]
MKRLGISIYPEHTSFEDNIEYMNKASQYGFKRIFTCLLSVEKSKEEILKEFKDIIEHGNSLGMETILDVSPRVFDQLDISYKDLSFFNETGASGIRLDMSYSGNEESMMTFNPFDLKIEINMSTGAKYIDNVMKYKPNMNNIIGSHNFYPHRYSGLSNEHFTRTSQQFRDLGIKTAAFVNSQAAAIGPWPVSEGLCTLEEHRTLPIDVQAKHLFATGLIDDVIIANAFASDEELELLSKLNPELLKLKVQLDNDIPDLERKIALEEFHFNRGDVSDYLIRSTQSRVKYKGHDFKVFNPEPIKRGDIIVESSLYAHYAGELQIALKDMENSGKTNIIGRVDKNELFLLDFIEPWQKFILYEG